ncbi:hypothetical protein SAMN05421770_101400 [Granulicella rosea]|uniref:Uncharacterized protein n=1 Tax=Granulicella rosea TaxID=474952 RepID=A0A239DC89_9BACT|nr:hypothetical protein [Granulicella rosea]SNS30026.1 hypothetical protein SAMN05421770_101400 [Granulicella rosea]
MSVEIHEPEIEALIERRMASGVFEDVEDVLLYALKSAPFPSGPASESDRENQSLREMFESVRGLADDIEFTRNPSMARPVDL